MMMAISPNLAMINIVLRCLKRMRYYPDAEFGTLLLHCRIVIPNERVRTD